MNFAARIAELTEQLTTLQGAHSTLQGAHKTANEQLVAANEQIATANGSITQLTADLAAANAKIAELKPKAEQTATAIAAAVVTQIAAAGVEPVAKVDIAGENTRVDQNAQQGSPKQRLAAAINAKLAQ